MKHVINTVHSMIQASTVIVWVDCCESITEIKMFRFWPEKRSYSVVIKGTFLKEMHTGAFQGGTKAMTKDMWTIFSFASITCQTCYEC